MKIYIGDLDEVLRVVELESTSVALDLEDYTPYRGKVTVHGGISKIGREVHLRVRVSGQALATCDRCLEPLERTFAEDCLWIFTPEPELLEQEDVYLLQPGQTEIAVARQVREALILMLPIKMLCSEECKGLCPHCGANLNYETCTCHIAEIDPRWAKLAKFRGMQE
ncbi:MAG: DUF177 domain-containing protein [bacterium]|jgi:uncharacterized protein|nr:DUF177 domain-containing protein [bacterium]